MSTLSSQSSVKRSDEAECSELLGGITLGALLLAGEEESVDVGEDTTSSNSGVGHELVELLIVSDGELNVAGHDSGLFVVLGGVSGELEDLSGEVLKDGSEVHGGTSTDSLGEAALLEESGDSTNGELESSLGGSGDSASATSLSSSTLSFSGHFDDVVESCCLKFKV